MKGFLQTGVLFLFITFFTSCALQGEIGLYEGEKDACGFAVNEYTGKGLRWDKSKFPISFYIHESVPPEAHKNFIAAIDHWNITWEEFLVDRGVEPFLLFAVVDKGVQYSGSPKNDGYNILFFVKDSFSTYGKSEIQAITSMYSSRWGINIKDTDIIVNNRNFVYFYDEDYNEDILAFKAKKISNSRNIASSRSMGFWFRLRQKIQNWFKFILKPFKKKKAIRQIAGVPKVPRGLVDFPSLMIHELGHSYGAAHMDESDQRNAMASRSERRTISVMEEKLPDGRARRNIGEYDLNNLFCGYFEYN